MLKLTSALVLLLVWVTGCASNDSESDPKSARSSLPTIMKPQLPAPVSAADAPVVKLEDAETKRVSLSSPDWLATTDGALWVRLDAGQVVKLDPVTGATQEHIEPPPGDGLCQGFGSAADAVYSCAYAGVIERIDPSTNKIVNQVKSDFSSDQGHLVLAGDKVWVLTPDGDKVTPIDPSDDSLGKPINLGSYCVELSGRGSVIYATCTSDGLVIRVDIARREVTHRLALTDPRTIWASSSGVFVSFEGGVAQLGPESLEPAAVYDVALDLGGGIYADSERAWLRADGGPFLTVVDPVAHKVVQTITAADLPSGGSVMRVGDVVWATASDDGTLVGVRTK
jgi:hypothetical protein